MNRDEVTETNILRVKTLLLFKRWLTKIFMCICRKKIRARRSQIMDTPSPFIYKSLELERCKAV